MSFNISKHNRKKVAEESSLDLPPFTASKEVVYSVVIFFCGFFCHLFQLVHIKLDG